MGKDIITNAVEVLLYAAALDLYRRDNAQHAHQSNVPRRRLPGHVTGAMLNVCDWEARPACLDSELLPGRSNEERNTDDAAYVDGWDAYEPNTYGGN